MDTIYLDNAATTRPAEETRTAVQAALEKTWGNPSSAHTLGVAAERIVTEARRRTAAAVGAKPDEIVFTSGGTEANALALFGRARSRGRRKNHIVTTGVEHSSVANACSALEQEGFSVTRLAPDKRGFVTAEAIAAAVTSETGIVSVIWVNNETGSIQPVLEAAEMIKSSYPDVFVHADGVQALGNVPVRLGRTALDSASFSAHKIAGPKGVGALWVRSGADLVHPWGGGSQEGGRRPGTENVPGIAGFGAAVQAAAFDADVAARVGRLRDELWQGIQDALQGRVPLRRNGPEPGDGAAPHILNVSFVGLKGEVLVHALAEKGVYASTGSACSARRGGGSATLRAMGLTEAEVEGGLRFSLSPSTTAEEIGAAAERIGAVAAQLYRFVR